MTYKAFQVCPILLANKSYFPTSKKDWPEAVKSAEVTGGEVRLATG
jgi:hypothetical protein